MSNINMQQYVSIVKSNFDEEEIKVIVEVGALDGKDSEYFKEEFPNAQVIAFEGLRENCENYKPSGVIWCNICIASYNGETVYHVKNTNGIHGMYDRGSIYGTEERIVPCWRLDYVVTKDIDMMKIDVEGATYDIFEGMGHLLDTVKIMHIETETIPYFKGQKMLHNQVFEYLNNKNFTCLEFAGEKIQGGMQFDSVWINNEHLDS